jgi:hypothetical protein
LEELNALVNFETEIENRLVLELDRFLPQFCQQLDRLWIEGGQVIRFDPNQEDAIEKVFAKIQDSMCFIFPETSEPNFTFGNDIDFFQNRMLHYLLFSRISEDTILQGDRFKQAHEWLQTLRSLWTDNGNRLMTIDLFIEQFYEDKRVKLNWCAETLLTDESIKGRAQHFIQSLEKQFFSGLEMFKNFRCGPFEIRIHGDGRIFIGAHTGQYVMEERISGKEKYFLFDDAFVAVILSKSDIIRWYHSKGLPGPVVVNAYGAHPFLRQPDASGQFICMGNSLTSDIVGETLPFVDRVMNSVHMGIKVMREGHHEYNKNNYYHRLSDPKFNDRLISKKDLNKYPEAFIAHYNKEKKS